MSAEATFWAQRQRPSGGSSAKLVLLALADVHNDHTGECRPKVATLAERCMLSERQVQRTLAGLERDELIARQARHAKRGGYQIANGYKLFIKAGAGAKNPCAPRGDTGVVACAPRGDTGVVAMGATSTSPLEPDIYEPSPESAPERARGALDGQVHQEMVSGEAAVVGDPSTRTAAPAAGRPAPARQERQERGALVAQCPKKGASRETGFDAEAMRERISVALRETARSLKLANGPEPGTGRAAEQAARRTSRALEAVR
jgi:hypothetical protein